MANIRWLVCRLQAMSVPEVAWRVSQKMLQKKEEKAYKANPVAATFRLFDEKLAGLKPKADRMYINYENKEFSIDRDLALLGGYSYQQYKKQWNAGFQTTAQWPDIFSYSLEYKQRDDIGDARTNWELNRHFQIAMLAKNYYASGDKEYIDELSTLFTDWNNKNSFLHGISWTSVMEVAIRTSNWCYAYAFLAKSKDIPGKLLEQLQIGILNMSDYIAQHYSRYSSANNHLIVEAFAIGQSGILFEYKPWIDLAVSILTRELPLQNYSDGVNKELSLHYQSFYMEAMGLMLRLLQKNKITVPDIWASMLDKMSQYMADCMGSNGVVIEFGDNDEGKILDLHGGEESYYKYVLGLLSCLLDKRYVDLTGCSENLKWLFTEEELKKASMKSFYQPQHSVCYKEGGNTILRSKDGRALIGIDHAALGFGSIAAHGHADALSFQMFVDGRPVFVDPGTYIYHCDLPSRNEFRKTKNHNTVCIGGQDQSKMLGAFLWGKKAECELLKVELGETDIIDAKHDGYNPDGHQRRYKLSGRCLDITDVIFTNNEWSVAFVIASELAKKMKELSVDEFSLGNVTLKTESKTAINCQLLPTDVSTRYGVKYKSKKIVVRGKGSATLNTRIMW